MKEFKKYFDKQTNQKSSKIEEGVAKVVSVKKYVENDGKMSIDINKLTTGGLEIEIYDSETDAVLTFNISKKNEPTLIEWLNKSI